MGVTVIGVDPHKQSHTAVVVDEDEEIAAELRLAADRRQVERLLGWAARWPDRLWAIENVNGLGRLLAQQLLSRGEVVVDVPAALSHRTRRLSGHSGRKTDAHDARSVAIAAANPTRLRRVEPEDLATVLGMILDRRRHLVTRRQRTICRVHALLAELTPGGAPRQLTQDKTAALLRAARPSTLAGLQRRQIAKELLEQWRWLDRRLPPVEARLEQTLQACDTTLTDIHGIATIGAATILAITGDVGRFPTPGHFAAFNGTAPLDASSGEVKRHRLNRGGNRQAQQRAAHRRSRPDQQTHQRPGLLPAQARRGQEPPRSAADAQAPALRRRLSSAANRRPPTPSGPGKDRRERDHVRVTGLHP